MKKNHEIKHRIYFEQFKILVFWMLFVIPESFQNKYRVQLLRDFSNRA